MAHIDYFFSTMSPFTYLAGTRLEEIAARYGATLSYKPLDILALFTRTGGTAPKDRHDNRKAYRMQELRRQSVKAGLAMNFTPLFFPVNTAPSSYAIIAAQKAGGGDLAALVHGFTRAVWAEERNIAEDEVIRDVMTRAGFDPAIADRGMMMAADTYMANLEEAVSRGVFGAPFYICDDDERFWGQDRLDDLDLHLAGKL
ncbi:MAG: 2-hydroxychromene-2-carboxylate isomerase [Paracoccaceae bacterium]|nr:2-hydroxychromene-2-carboxylate isomerase [Paracoccaceae bacterium]